jgi:hypothetical protein
MDFVTAVRYAKLGYRIRRASWSPNRYLSEDSEIDGYRWMDNVLADDWEIITLGVVEYFPIVYADEVIEE